MKTVLSKFSILLLGLLFLFNTSTPVIAHEGEFHIQAPPARVELFGQEGISEEESRALILKDSKLLDIFSTLVKILLILNISSTS